MSLSRGAVQSIRIVLDRIHTVFWQVERDEVNQVVVDWLGEQAVVAPQSNQRLEILEAERRAVEFVLFDGLPDDLIKDDFRDGALYVKGALRKAMREARRRVEVGEPDDQG